MNSDQQISSEKMAQSAPPILPYAAKQQQNLTSSFLLGSILLAITFAVTFWFVETVTSNVMLFHVQVLGPVNPGTREWDKLEDHQFGDLIIEFLWSIPATIIVLAGLMTFGPRSGARLSAKAFVAIVAGAVIYSWVRWGLYLTALRPSERADFYIAVMLAALAGVGTSFIRSK